VSKESLVIQITGESSKVEAFIELIRPYGIKEIARTGTTAFPRGSQKNASQRNHYSIV
jgi:acetolactate synthase-1/3 small subunit